MESNIIPAQSQGCQSQMLQFRTVTDEPNKRPIKEGNEKGYFVMSSSSLTHNLLARRCVIVIYKARALLFIAAVERWQRRTCFTSRQAA